MTRNIPTMIHFLLYQPFEFNPKQIDTAVRIAVDEGLLPANRALKKNAEGKLIESFCSGDIDEWTSRLYLQAISTIDYQNASHQAYSRTVLGKFFW